MVTLPKFDCICISRLSIIVRKNKFKILIIFVSRHLKKSQTHQKIPKTLLDMVLSTLNDIQLKFFQKYLILFFLEPYKECK